jgi:hypothetical protein
MPLATPVPFSVRSLNPIPVGLFLSLARDRPPVRDLPLRYQQSRDAWALGLRITKAGCARSHTPLAVL